jgi:hypothetical protein
MSANPTDTENQKPTAKEAPTAQQSSQPGVPKKITNAQTVCNEKNEKGKSCNGFLKQLRTGGEEADKHLRGDDVKFKCQTCGAIYIGPPLGHVRDPKKQSRFVEKELMAILQAAGGTLPAFKMSERGTLVPVEETHHAPAPAAAPATAPPTPPKPAPAATPKPAPATAPAVPEAAPAASRVRDSSAEADAHRPAAEAQAATGQASAAPMSPAAATASPAAGAETVSDLAPEASTELTPGAPPDSRTPAAKNATETAAPSTETTDKE